MPDIDSPQVKKITNEEFRVVADALATCYLTCKTFDLKRTAGDYLSLIPNTADVVVDGAATDGRQVVTGAKLNNILVRAYEFIADYEAGGMGKLNTVLAVAVNGRSNL